MHRILLVEDNEEIQKMIPGILGPTCAVAVAGTFEAGRRLSDANEYDLYILDVLLPDGSGFKLCSHIRQSEGKADVPVIFLTGCFDVEDKLMAFSLGADDYIVKPFDGREFRARVVSKLGRSERTRKAADTLLRGDLRFELLSQKVTRVAGGVIETIELTPHEFKLLLHFARHEGHVLTRDQIIDAIWGSAANILDRTVDAHVSNLRRKIRESRCAIRSVHGAGYKFVAAAASSGSAEPSGARAA